MLVSQRLRPKASSAAFLVVVLGTITTFQALALGFGSRASEFSYDTDPAKVVLFVCSPRADRGLDSMTLYGDGRLELRREWAEREDEEYVLQLDEQQARALLRLAVDHGLADYDSDRIREQQLQKGTQFPQSTAAGATAGATTVLLSLASYEGRFERPEGIEQTIRLALPEPKLKDELDIPEISGVAKLRREMLEMTAKARAIKAPAPLDPDFAQARFSFSSDPAKAVLSVTAQAGLMRNKTSMIAYGNGRIEIHGEGTEHGREHYEFFLEPSELRELLALAVGHGLVEHDETGIRARQYRKLLGRPYPGLEDGSNLTISLDLKTYTRNGHTRNDVTRTIHSEAPWLAVRAFPEIEELQGCLEIQRRLFAMLDRGRQQSEEGK